MGVDRVAMFAPVTQPLHRPTAGSDPVQRLHGDRALALAVRVTPMWTWLLFPLIALFLIIVTVPVCMIVSSLYPRFRDVAIIWTVLSTALFYGSPVFYTLSIVAVHHYRLSQIMHINPLAPILTLARKWMIDNSAPAPWSVGLLLGIVAPLAIVGLTRS